MKSSSSDHGVAETASDALRCKLSAVELGYFDDPFLRHFVTNGARRLPLIHRGYHLRHVAINTSVERFVAAATATATDCQILSLGAGFDTLCFRLGADNLLQHVAAFVEVDSLSICEAKTRMWLENPQVFADCFGHDNMPTNDATGHRQFTCALAQTKCMYHLVACDLGDHQRLEEWMHEVGLDPAKPTLVVAECVMSYIDPEQGTGLLHWLASFLRDAVMVMYDPFQLDDAFGLTLRKYFAAKGCELRALQRFCSMNDHIQRFLTLSTWTRFAAMDLNAVYHEWVDDNEKARLQRIEPFDEFAEWKLCNAHYALVVACNASFPTSESPTSAVLNRMARPTRLVGTCSANKYQIQSQVLLVRSFLAKDAEHVRKIFETSHLEYSTSTKAVKRFVASRLQTDMKHIEASYLRPKGCGFWVAEHDGTVVGCIALKAGKQENKRGELCRLGVLETHRRQGIARLLVDTLEQFARACDYDTVQADTIDHMQPAQEMYQALGYRQTSKEELRGFSIVSFVKHIKA